MLDARFRHPALAAALSIAFLCSLLATISAPLSASPISAPPPIPTPEDRARLIAAESAKFESSQIAEVPEARAVHDEYDVTHYDITMSLDIPNHIITGVVAVDALSALTNLSRVDIDLNASMNVTGATAGGAPTLFTRNGNVVTVFLDAFYQVGQPFDISVSYNGTPTPAVGPFRWQTHNGVPMVLTYSEPFGAPAWWVCKDDPKDKATFALHLTVPDTLFAVSNGVLDSTVNNGNGTATFNWTHDYPMSPYLFSLAITNFQTWTEVYTALDDVTTMDVHYWAYPEDFADAQIAWGRNIEMMEYYAGIFGEYPFLTEKYAIAEFQHPGAMEHQTATSMGNNWIVPSMANDYVVAHELSHSWVGDMITMTEWSHAWCKEGFATYCEALYFEDKYGVDYYHSYMASLNVLNYAANQIYNIQPPLASTIYYKGAWVFHMLRHIVGDQNFFDAIYAYTQDPDFRYGVANTEDLRGVFEAISGMDLVWFFDEWIYHPGYPVYEWSPQATWTGSGYDISVTIEQNQQVSWPIFTMPIDIRVRTLSGDQTFVVWDSLQTQSFQLHVDGAGLLGVDFDPQHWIIRGNVTLTPPVVDAGAPAIGPGAGPFFLAQNRPNPFRPATRIGYRLDRASAARLDVFDAAGRLVVTLVDRPLPAGPGEIGWDGRDRAGRKSAPGVYYYRFRAGDATVERSMVLAR